MGYRQMGGVMKEIICEFSFNDVQEFINKLSAIDIGTLPVYMCHKTHPVSQMSHARIVEETLTDGSKVREIRLG
jgi:hypothetical protein